MKTHSGLVAAIAEPENLWQAWLAARKGKRRVPAVAAFEVDAERQLSRLRRELLQATFRPGPYRLKYVSDPKRRLIAAASFRDRVVHHGIVRVVHPCFGRRFIHDSYACLPGRGSHRALIAFLSRLRSHGFVMKLDMVRYFPSVAWDQVLALLAERTPDARFLDLIGTLLESAGSIYNGPEARCFLVDQAPPPPRHGLPIGNFTSQWIGNFFLDGLDHFIKRELKVRAYQRYMDDLVLFADSKRQLHAWRKEIVAWVAAERGLQVHSKRAHPNPSHHRHHYLGHVITRAGIRPGPRLVRRMRQRLPARLHGDPERLARSLAAYRGAFLL